MSCCVERWETGRVHTCCSPRRHESRLNEQPLKRFRQGLPAEYFKLNKGEPQKMLKRISTLILSTGMCLALAGPVSLAFQDQSQSQDKTESQDKMSGDKMKSHDKMGSHDKMSDDKMESNDKMSKDKDKMSKDKMDKEEKMDKMDHQSN
jgi:hypothetical protein